MQEPGQATPVRFVESALEPRELPFLFGIAASQYQGIEADETPAVDIVPPLVRPEVTAPTSNAFAVHRLKPAVGFADIMVPGYAQHRRAQRRKDGSAVRHVLFDVCAIDGHVSRVNDEIRSMRIDPSDERLPIAREVPLIRTEVGI